MSSDINQHARRLAAESYVDRFENRFEDYVGGVATVIHLHGSATAARPTIQALVNAYHDLGREVSPLHLSPSHFNTLRMFVLITGASLEHSGEDEGLNIIKQARIDIVSR